MRASPTAWQLLGSQMKLAWFCRHGCGQLQVRIGYVQVTRRRVQSILVQAAATAWRLLSAGRRRCRCCPAAIDAPSAGGHRYALPLEQPHAWLEGSLHLCCRMLPVQRCTSMCTECGSPLWQFYVQSVGRSRRCFSCRSCRCCLRRRRCSRLLPPLPLPPLLLALLASQTLRPLAVPLDLIHDMFHCRCRHCLTILTQAAGGIHAAGRAAAAGARCGSAWRAAPPPWFAVAAAAGPGGCLLSLLRLLPPLLLLLLLLLLGCGCCTSRLQTVAGIVAASP